MDKKEIRKETFSNIGKILFKLITSIFVLMFLVDISTLETTTNNLMYMMIIGLIVFILLNISTYMGFNKKIGNINTVGLKLREELDEKTRKKDERKHAFYKLSIILLKVMFVFLLFALMAAVPKEEIAMGEKIQLAMACMFVLWLLQYLQINYKLDYLVEK